MRRLLLLLPCLVACAAPAQSNGVPAPSANDAGDTIVFDVSVVPDASVPADVDVTADFPLIELADFVSDPGDFEVPDSADDGQPTDASAATEVMPPTDAAVDAAPDTLAPGCTDDADKQCPMPFSWPAQGDETAVEVRGDWGPNTWQQGVALELKSNAWQGTVPLPYGKPVLYKFFLTLQGGKTAWKPDPANPDSVDDGFGSKNSLIKPLACDPWTCKPLQSVCGYPTQPGAFDWRDAVLYFVFVDRFKNGNPGNDKPSTAGGVAPIANWQGGDWQGVRDKIKAGWFEKLGVNALWLTVPMDATDAVEVGDDGKTYTGYHGYWPRDVNKPEARFGTMADLQGLVQDAHQAGIRVVIDYAMNHVHSDSPVWQQHKGDGWFHGLKKDGQNCVCGSGVCPWDGPSGIFCWFQTYLPDFDFDNQAARKASVDNAVWWLQQSGADGFRLDAIKHVENAWLTDLRARLNSDVEAKTGAHPWLVGETYTGDMGFINSFVSPCSKLDGQFDFPLRAKLLEIVLQRKGAMSDLSAFLDQNATFYGPGAVMSTFLGNHDVPRSIHYAQDPPLWSSVWDAGKDKAWQGQPGTVAGLAAYERMALGQTVLWTTPGVPLLYYGDEVGMAGAGDPDNRRAMAWSGWTKDQEWLLARMQKLGQIRKQHKALRQGVRTTIQTGKDVLVYRMDLGADSVTVALNRGDKGEVVSGLPAAWLDELTGESGKGGEVTLGPRSARIVVAKP
jgi:glycosidase